MILGKVSRSADSDHRLLCCPLAGNCRNNGKIVNWQKQNIIRQMPRVSSSQFQLEVSLSLQKYKWRRRLEQTGFLTERSQNDISRCRRRILVRYIRNGLRHPHSSKRHGNTTNTALLEEPGQPTADDSRNLHLKSPCSPPRPRRNLRFKIGESHTAAARSRSGEKKF